MEIGGPLTFYDMRTRDLYCTPQLYADCGDVWSKFVCGYVGMCVCGYVCICLIGGIGWECNEVKVG